MRRSTRGILGIDVVLSISHDPSTGVTSGILLTRSDQQTAFITKELERYKTVAGYPLLLPLLLSDYQRHLLNQESKRLWSKLLEVETQSGQTGAPAIFMVAGLRNRDDFDGMIKGALQVVQLSAAWVNYTEVLLLVIEDIQKSIGSIHDSTPQSRSDDIEATESVMVEYTRFVHHRCKIMQSELQYIYKRGQAQMTAVSIF